MLFYTAFENSLTYFYVGKRGGVLYDMTGIYVSTGAQNYYGCVNHLLLFLRCVAAFRVTRFWIFDLIYVDTIA